MSHRRGSVLIISLWIMAILVIFALSVAHRASIHLRLAKYQINKLKATYLARAGINKAILQVDLSDKDSPAMLSDPWSTGFDPSLLDKVNVFENVTLRDMPRGEGPSREVFSVRFARPEDNGSSVQNRCLEDEESKINLNVVNTPLRKGALEMLLVDNAGMVREEAAELRKMLALWIGDPAAEPLVADVDQSFFKREFLRSPEELLLVLEYFFQAEEKIDNPQAKAQEVYNKIKDYITVYGEGAINVNTVSRLVLAKYCSAAVELIMGTGEPALLEGLDDAVAQDVAGNIIDLRSASMFVQPDLQNIDTLIASINNTTRITPLGNPGTDPKSAILEKFLPHNETDGNSTTIIPGILSAKSSNFRINSIGQADTVTRTIIAVYDRHAVIYWHEK